MSNAMKILNGFFWLAFAAFLGMSIPHLAYVFRSYEPVGDGFDGMWWFVSYGGAVSIDVMIGILSYVASEVQRQRGERHVLGIIWAFVIGLSLVSWYFNWLFAKQNANSMLARIMNQVLVSPWGHDVSVATVTPLIVSAIPVFIIAYTYVSDKIITEQPRSATDLEQEADEAERLVKQQTRLDNLRRQQREQRWGGRIGSLKSFMDQTRETFKRNEQPKPEGIPSGLVEEPGSEREHDLQLTLTQNQIAPDNESFQLRFALKYLEQHPEVKRQIIDLGAQLVPAEEIADQIRQQNNLLVTGELVSQILTRVIPEDGKEVLPMAQEGEPGQQASNDSWQVTAFPSENNRRVPQQALVVNVAEIRWAQLPKALPRKVVAQEYLGCSPRQVGNLIAENKLRVSTAEGLKGYILTSSLKKYMEEREHQRGQTSTWMRTKDQPLVSPELEETAFIS